MIGFGSILLLTSGTIISVSKNRFDGLSFGASAGLFVQEGFRNIFLSHMTERQRLAMVGVEAIALLGLGEVVYPFLKELFIGGIIGLGMNEFFHLVNTGLKKIPPTS